MGDISDNTINVSIHDEDNSEPITTTDSGAKKGLDVYLINSDISISFGADIRYTEMTVDQTIPNGSYGIVYSLSGVGKIYSIYLRLEVSDVDIRCYIDGQLVIDGINALDVNENYKIQADSNYQVPRFFAVADGGRSVMIEFPSPAIFQSSFSIQLKGNASGKVLERGMIVRSLS